MSRKLAKFGLLSVTLLLLNACGYRLCNPCVAWPEDVNNIYVSTNKPSSAVYAYLQENLQAQGLSTSDTEAGADAVFVLLNESKDKRLLAVADGNEPAEYELIYRVSYRVDKRNTQTSAAGRPVVGGEVQDGGNPSRIGALPFVLGTVNVAESRRAQVFNPDAVLAVEAEAQSLYDEMAQYLANQITRAAVGQLSE